MTLFFKGWQWFTKGLLVLGLVLVTVWLGHRVQWLRTQNTALNDTLATLPETLSAEAVQRAALTQHRMPVERLQRLLPRREEVGGVVSALEREGTQRTVAVVITDLREAEIRDESGAVVPPNPEGRPPGGPLRDIRIVGLATGRPANVLSWLAAAEQLPYLLHVEEWKLRVLEATRASGAQLAVPTTRPNSPETVVELSFTFLLSIRYVE